MESYLDEEVVDEAELEVVESVEFWRMAFIRSLQRPWVRKMLCQGWQAGEDCCEMTY